MHINLKPCPFCGEQPRLFHGAYDGEFFYKCDNVHTCETTVSTNIQKGQENAAMIWNNRANIKHWPCGVHTEEDGWEYLGSVNSIFSKKYQGMDVYRHSNIKIYSGISMQYGPNEEDYYSYAYIKNDQITNSFEYNILKAYAIKFDRITKK